MAERMGSNGQSWAWITFFILVMWSAQQHERRVSQSAVDNMHEPKSGRGLLHTFHSCWLWDMCISSRRLSSPDRAAPETGGESFCGNYYSVLNAASRNALIPHWDLKTARLRARSLYQHVFLCEIAAVLHHRFSLTARYVFKSSLNATDLLQRKVNISLTAVASWDLF